MSLDKILLKDCLFYYLDPINIFVSKILLLLALFYFDSLHNYSNNFRLPYSICILYISDSLLSVAFFLHRYM